MTGEPDRSRDAVTNCDMKTLICVSCGGITDGSMPHPEASCEACGTSFRERPPSTYARMEGFLEFENMSRLRRKRHVGAELKNDGVERWLAFCFWSLVILLALLAMIRA